MTDFREKVNVQGAAFVQQHILHKGIKLYGDRARKATTKEVDQL